jgi:glyoxylase-like metal-dependent hydrolase (beta-lactamase superfamily II)
LKELLNNLKSDEMQIGNIKIDIVETGLFALDGGAMFGVVPKTLWAKAYSPGDEYNRIPLAARNVLVQFGDRKVLIDVGNGTKYTPSKAEMYDINLHESSAEVNLPPHGISRHEITDVVLTHLHFDHAGGSTFMNGDKLEPTFPNARYYVQKEHFEHALHPYDKDGASFMKNDFMPLVENNMLELVEGDVEILPGIRAHRCYGHTVAMQLIQITAGEHNFLFTADLLPTAAHLPFPYIMGYDNQPLVTLEEKKKWLPFIAEDDWAIIFEHDKTIQSAKIQLDFRGKNYEVKEVITF